MVGLALSGGALRGTAHIGALKALEEAHIPVKYLSGSSAGSFVAGVYACGVPVHILEAEALRLNDSLLDFNANGAAKAVLSCFGGRKAGFKGLVKGDAVQKLALRLTGGKKICEATLGLAISAVDLYSGKTIFFSNADIKPKGKDYLVLSDCMVADAIAASSSIPAVFVPRQFQGYCLVDGGVTEYVPTKVLRDMGAKYVIAVDLGRETETRQTADDVLEISARSFGIMNRRLADFSDKYADIVIAPFVADIGMFEFKRINECIQRGYQATKMLIPAIKSAIMYGSPRHSAT